jgi:hypothetical protein
MSEAEVQIGSGAGAAEVERVAEDVLSSFGLDRHLKTTLAKYPGCIHWHYCKPSCVGTLELTFWPSAHRLWFKVHAGRRAEWIEPVIQSLTHTLEQTLA